MKRLTKINNIIPWINILKVLCYSLLAYFILGLILRSEGKVKVDVLVSLNGAHIKVYKEAKDKPEIPVKVIEK